MPYPPCSPWPPGSPGGRPGPQPWRSGRFQAPSQARTLALQGFTLLHRILELLLDLADPGLELLTGGLLLHNLPLGFGQGLFQGLDLGRRPTHIMTLQSVYIIYSF